MESQNSFTTPPVLGGFGEKKSNSGTQWYIQNRVYDGNYLACCLCGNIPGGSQLYLVMKENGKNKTKLNK